MSSKNEKRQRLFAFISVNMIQYPRTLKNNIFNIFHPDTNPVIGHVLVHFVDKTHVLVATVELIWLMFLNILSFNFIPTPRKSLSFKRFRRNYVNRPPVVVINHCQNYTAFLLDVRCSKWPRLFFTAVCSQSHCICVDEHTCCSSIVNSKMRKQRKRCEIVINI